MHAELEAGETEEVNKFLPIKSIMKAVKKYTPSTDSDKLADLQELMKQLGEEQ